jgi:hypothetical protein
MIMISQKHDGKFGDAYVAKGNKTDALLSTRATELTRTLIFNIAIQSFK